jgi:hypothetical protein
MRERWTKRLVKIAMIAPVAFVAVGFLIMLLWNWLVPPILGGRAIDFWQAWGIFLLSKLLFGGFHGGPGRRHTRSLRERWERMTPEERDRFRRHMGPGPEPAATGQA